MSNTVQTPAPTMNGQGSFRQPAHDVLARVRNAMKELINASPGSVTRAVELQNSLNIYSTLAWQTFKIATAPELIDVVEHILTPKKVNTLLAAAIRKGLPSSVVSEVKAAMEMYTVLLHEHAGDTDALMMMLTSLQPKKKSLLDEPFRKGAFQHNRLVWGYQEDMRIGCLIANLCDNDPSAYPTIIVTGHVGYHQFRPVKKLISTEYRSGNALSQPPDDNTDSLHDILTEFSSPELKFDIFRDPDSKSTSKTRVVLPDLGRKSTVDIFQFRANKFRFSAENEIVYRIYVRSIYTMLHLDIVILGSSSRCSPFARTYGRIDDQLTDNFAPEDLLPIELSPTYLGSLVDIPPAKGVPRYPEMIRSVLQRFGHYGKEFDVYRCRMAYPILGSAVFFGVDPARPTSDNSVRNSDQV